MTDTVERLVPAKGNHIAFKQDIAKAKRDLAEQGYQNIQSKMDHAKGGAVLTAEKP